jgi:hypothetical protein
MDGVCRREVEELRTKEVEFENRLSFNQVSVESWKSVQIEFVNEKPKN